MARSLSHSLIALLALPLAAQAVDNSYPRVSMFYGTAPTIGTKGAHQVRESMLVGLEYSHPVWRGEAFGAVEWRDFRSIWREVTQFSPRDNRGNTIQEDKNKTGYAGVGNSTRGYITAFTRRPNYPDDRSIASDMRFDSVHMSKCDLGGGSAKVAYRQYFKAPFVGQVGVQGGLTVNFLTSAEWARADIHVLSFRSYDPQNTTPNSNWTSENPNLDAPVYGRLFNDRVFQDNKEIKVLPGIFAGARFFINDNFFFETNITTLGYTALEYVPTAYTGKEGYVEQTDRTKVVWEFNVGFRF